MSRNGAGVFAVLNPIMIGALRSSSAVNADFSDAGNEITNTLPLDGTVGMNGPFKAYDGSQTAPGISFASDTRLGFRRSDIGVMRWVSGGVDRMYVDAAGKMWHLSEASVAGALNLQQPLTGENSNAIEISEFAANGAALNATGVAEGWQPDPLTFLASFTTTGSGTVLPTGVCGDIQIPVGCTLFEAALLADQIGSCVVDIWRQPYASYPATVAQSLTGGNPLTIASSLGVLDNLLAGWTTAIAAGDCLRFNINSVSAITRLTIALGFERLT